MTQSGTYTGNVDIDADIDDLTMGPRRLERGWVDETKPYTRFEVVPLSPTIGAELRGFDIGAPLDADGFAEVNRCLLEWKVLFFRGQSITGDQHRAFGVAVG